ncbi:MAG: M20/M25/M40 family metallo-hydrolase [Bacteroidales bacterium]
MKSLLTLFLLFCAVFTNAQNPIAISYADKLDSANLRVSLKVLTSTAMNGRKSSEAGGQMAADYLIEQLTQYGVEPAFQRSYKQSIQAYQKTSANKYFYLPSFNYAQSYSYDNASQHDSVIMADSIVFAGYGVHDATYNDFSGVDIQGKVVMVLEGEGPRNKFGVKCHTSGSAPDMDYIRSQRPAALFLVRKDFNNFGNYSYNRVHFSSATNQEMIPVVKINELLANSLLAPARKSVKQLQYEMEQNCRPASFEFAIPVHFNGNNAYKLADIDNIVAVVEGSDLKDECVVLMAHYDHIGKTYGGEVYPGADDNASGVSAVLEVARLLNAAKKAGKGPRRSVVMLFTTAEEDGLHGSDYYVKHPVFPLDKTVAAINLDMVGRNGSQVAEESIAKGYIYALTHTRDYTDTLVSIPDSINRMTTNLHLLKDEGSSYNNFFSRSDHYNFFRKGIPSIFFTNGSHEDLHKTTDVAAKIEMDAMQQRTKLVFLTVWELATNISPFKPLITDVSE